MTPEDPQSLSITYDHLSELIRLQARQSEQKIYGQYLDLRQRIEQIKYDQENLAAAVLARIDAHEDYHRKNEHRWGMLKLAGRYPFRFATLAGAMAWAAGGLGAGLNGRLQTLLRHLLELMGL